MDELNWLCRWYQSNCDGDWEHSHGVKIETLDNPGWWVEIDLTYTELANKDFVETNQYNSDEDWLVCKVKDNVFNGYSDPQKLELILKTFHAWQESVCGE